ncbi:MAG: hypothetical protein IRZ10_02220 [Thermoflavifilum sp.]|nr:hypothetical protein [Thermoflavifilum sp.]MCL6513208.1 hypothetical protein [Alicyclobacillus sp.]
MQYKRWLAALAGWVSAGMVMAGVAAPAAQASDMRAPQSATSASAQVATEPAQRVVFVTPSVSTTTASAKGTFSGGASTRGRSYSSGSSFGSSGVYSTSGTYHSGYRSPSPSVSRGTYGAYGSSFGSSFGSHLFSFGTGWLLGSLFHPFGGYWGMAYHPFSLWGLIGDIILLVIIIAVVRRFLFRR